MYNFLVDLKRETKWLFFIKKFFWKHKTKSSFPCTKLVLGHTLKSSNPHTFHKSTMVSGTTLPSWTDSYTNKLSKTKKIIYRQDIKEKDNNITDASFNIRNVQKNSLGIPGFHVHCSQLILGQKEANRQLLHDNHQYILLLWRKRSQMMIAMHPT